MNKTIAYITRQLEALYPHGEAREIAFWMSEETTGMSRTEIICKDTLNIPNIEIILQRLLNHEPVQYIFGSTTWNGLELKVNRHTLIPRPETAELVKWIIDDNKFRKGLKVLDIGTGSGCIALALKLNCPSFKLTGLDISKDALQVARYNAEKYKCEIDFRQCDILNNELKDNFDIIVSNPPYITTNEKKDMEANVLNYEPPMALFVPNADPLLFYRRIAMLRLSPLLYFEINPLFEHRLRSMLLDMGYNEVETKNDIFQKPRMLRARL
ncbi:MAG: peptide chain release factor N(5)-glutamine methyltransferase [Paludibacteraceae bacterium]|nr:peptide chain release factor N(5)-glutamine methyltransferase [Paludibacteraceae bacterium]